MQTDDTLLSIIKKNDGKKNYIRDASYDIAKKIISKEKDIKKRQKVAENLLKKFYDDIGAERLITKSEVIQILAGIKKALSFEKEKKLIDMISKKELLRKKIDEEKDIFKNMVAGLYDVAQNSIDSLKYSKKKEIKETLYKLKLKDTQMLGFLKESIQEAILTTIEKGKHIGFTTYEIAKSITYESTKEGKFKRERVNNVLETVIGSTIEIADENQGIAKEIITNCVNGAKDGLANYIKDYKDEIENAPKEIYQQKMSQIQSDLIKVEKDFIDILKQEAEKSNGVSKDIIGSIINNFDSYIVRLKVLVVEAREAFLDRVDAIKKDATENKKKLMKKTNEKISSIKKRDINKAVNQTKNFSKDVFLASKKIIDGAIKGAKDSIKDISKDTKDKS